MRCRTSDALSAGKPVISNHEGWQCQIAVEHDVGCTMSSENPDDAAACLQKYARDTQWLEGAAVRAKSLAVDRFSRDTLARAEQVFRRAVGRQAGDLEP
jgi:hypothetical protein